MGLLPRFVGMTTDSRSLLSYPRHEYFRRVLCNLLGDDMKRGFIPDDLELIGGDRQGYMLPQRESVLRVSVARVSKILTAKNTKELKRRGDIEPGVTPVANNFKRNSG